MDSLAHEHNGHAPVAPPDTPAERRKRKVRDSIIKAAEMVFAEEGEAGLSMRRLAEQIDYSPAAIYKYFASKDELLATIREQFFERLLARIEASGDSERADVDSFQAVLRAYVETGVENANHYRMALTALPNSEPREGTLQFEAGRRFLKRIETLIDNGVFRNVDPLLASKSVYASVHGLTMLLVTLPDFPCNEEGRDGVLTRSGLIDFHVRLIQQGLLARPA